MRKGILLATGALTLTLLVGPVMAQDAGSGQRVAGPDRGDQVERRFDRRGDIIDNRLDRAARRAHAADHDRVAHRLDRRGDGIDRRLDRKGRQLDRRIDRRTDRRQ